MLEPPSPLPRTSIAPPADPPRDPSRDPPRDPPHDPPQNYLKVQ